MWRHIDKAETCSLTSDTQKENLCTLKHIQLSLPQYIHLLFSTTHTPLI